MARSSKKKGDKTEELLKQLREERANVTKQRLLLAGKDDEMDRLKAQLEAHQSMTKAAITEAQDEISKQEQFKTDMEAQQRVIEEQEQIIKGKDQLLAAAQEENTKLKQQIQILLLRDEFLTDFTGNVLKKAFRP